MALEMTYASRNIGDIFFTLRKDSTINGAVPADGSEFKASDFGTDENANPYTLCVNDKLPNVDFATYNLQVKNQGCCAYFGIDVVNGKFKVPTLKNVFIEAGDVSTLAQYIAPGLPKLTAASTGDHSHTGTTSNSGAHNHYNGVANDLNAKAQPYVYGATQADIAANTVTGTIADETLYRYYQGYTSSVGNHNHTFTTSASGGHTHSVTSSVAESDTVQPKALILRPMVQLVTAAGSSSSSDDSGDSGSGDTSTTDKVPYIFVPGTEAKALEVNADFEYVLQKIAGLRTTIDDVSGSLDEEPVVHQALKETITGIKTFTSQIWAPSVELTGGINHGGYLDFHWQGSSEDFTARIIESVKGYLALNQSPAASDNSTKIATTNFVKSVLTGNGTGLATFSKSQNGYCKFSNGIVLMWGRTYPVGPSGVTVTLPTNLPSGVGVCVGCDHGITGATGYHIFSGSIINATQINITASAIGTGCSWLVMGY